MTRTAGCFLWLVLLTGCSVQPIAVVYEGAPWGWPDRDWRSLADADMRYLVSRQSYGDVRVLLEFRPDARVNSGFFVRCADRKDINPGTCYEANIWDDHPRQEFRTGALVTLVQPAAQVNTVDQWNRMEVVAVGDRVTVSINGVQTAELTGARRLTGHIALQWGGQGVIQVRRLEVTPL